MATSLAATAARRAANLTRLSYPTSKYQPSSIIQRRTLSSDADHHGPQRIDIWKDPMSPSKWKEEQFVIVSLAGWGLLIYGSYKFFTGGKKNNDKKVVEAA